MKYSIKPIEIAPKIWLGVDEEDEWRLFYESRKPEDEWHVASGRQCLLDFVALVLRNTEAVELLIIYQLYGSLPSIEQFNDRAVQKLRPRERAVDIQGGEIMAKNKTEQPDDICGICDKPGADKMARWTGGGVYWPGEFRPETEFVHQECEHEETRRAHAALTQDQRDAALRNI